jgi:hypothetical protein
MAGLANAAGMAKLRNEALLEVELLGQQCPKTGNPVPPYEAVIKLLEMPLDKRFILQTSKFIGPSNHQPIKQDSTYLDPITRLEEKTAIDDVSDVQSNTSDNPSGTDYTPPQQETGSGANLYGKGMRGRKTRKP